MEALAAKRIVKEKTACESIKKNKLAPQKKSPKRTKRPWSEFENHSKKQETNKGTLKKRNKGKCGRCKKNPPKNPAPTQKSEHKIFSIFIIPSYLICNTLFMATKSLIFKKSNWLKQTSLFAFLV